jgi:hypothetical protein
VSRRWGRLLARRAHGLVAIAAVAAIGYDLFQIRSLLAYPDIEVTPAFLATIARWLVALVTTLALATLAFRFLAFADAIGGQSRTMNGSR